MLADSMSMKRLIKFVSEASNGDRAFLRAKSQNPQTNAKRMEQEFNDHLAGFWTILKPPLAVPE